MKVSLCLDDFEVVLKNRTIFFQSGDDVVEIYLDRATLYALRDALRDLEIERYPLF